MVTYTWVYWRMWREVLFDGVDCVVGSGDDVGEGNIPDGVGDVVARVYDEVWGKGRGVLGEGG